MAAERVQDLSKAVTAIARASFCLEKIRQSTSAWTNFAAINEIVFSSRGSFMWQATFRGE
jgi:hypothetical protein